MARRQRGMPTAGASKLSSLGMGMFQKKGLGGSAGAASGSGMKTLTGNAVTAAKAMRLKKGLGGKAGGY